MFNFMKKKVDVMSLEEYTRYRKLAGWLAQPYNQVKYYKLATTRSGHKVLTDKKNNIVMRLTRLHLNGKVDGGI